MEALHFGSAVEREAADRECVQDRCQARLAKVRAVLDRLDFKLATGAMDHESLQAALDDAMTAANHVEVVERVLAQEVAASASSGGRGAAVRSHRHPRGAEIVQAG